MSAQRETVIESVTQWTGGKAGIEPGVSPSAVLSSTIPESKKEQQRIPLSEIALAASIAFTAIVLPNATDRLSQSVLNYLKPSLIFRCEKDCASSSAEDEINKQTRRPLERELETLFRNARSEIVENTHESNFANELHTLLLQYGSPVVAILSDFIRDPSVDAETASEALRVMGSVRDEHTEVSRFRLLVQALNRPSPILRDSAALALFDMAEPGAIPYLKEAAEREEYASLRKDYLQIIEELEAV